jgi:murein DD-endopeptidase MepM/ murein hydrolase activator NlpD
MDEDPTPSRRELIVSLLGVAGAVAVGRAVGPRLLGGDSSTAATSALSGPATAGRTAQRLGVTPEPTVPTTTTVAPPPPTLELPPEGKLAFPIDAGPKCYVLDNYGDCRSGGSRAHIGVDILDERGRTIFAVADGRLTYQFTDTGTAGFGWTLQGDDGRTYRYFHLDSFAPGLELGDTVRFGDPIGYVGSSGNFLSDGTENRANIHLHFEVHEGRNNPIDPLPLLVVPDGVPVGPPLKSCAARL